MTEYITKEQAVNVVNTAFGHIYDSDSTTVCLVDLQNEIVATLDEHTEPADVAPVVHAENVANAHPSDEFECSNCDLILRDYCRYDPEDDVCFEFTDWNHCPFCGARMDGEEE